MGKGCDRAFYQAIQVHQRFTLAHKLYHYDHHRYLAMLFIDYSAIASKLEHEANRGAAKMLMPVDQIRAFIYALRDRPRNLIDTLAREFRVSRKTMEIRLEELGIRR